MSRTYHHKQTNHYAGYDYGGKYRCNRDYGCGYGPFGRRLAHKEIRKLLSEKSCHL